MDTALSEVFIFKLFRAETATGTVTTPPIVITLDIIKYRCPHNFPANKVLAVDAFHFQRVKEAFRTCVIVAVASGAHASMQVVPLQQCLIIC